MDDGETTSRMNTKVEGQDLLMERVFAAPRDLVFKAFSEQERLAEWWGPEGWRTESRRFEFMPDGVWHYCMRCTDEAQGEFYGQESWGKAVYHKISAPEKIVYTDMFVNEEGQPVDGMPQILVTVKLLDEENKTRVTVRSHFTSDKALQQVLDMGVIEGFTSQFDRLAGYLHKSQEELLDYH
ncbi:SRPBCC domain-containing protein [Sporolactobacillus shoreae]|uniref:SRPBCC domain-containing protein n=1 Tax=Sporolactobacillus shoreae TaxID=1465501 RepID=A0A4Z0GRQ4_9BACL|nr:SRPBCC domain-containing protein [Sporolactobacillus shoreae]TGA98861.1 SRPBCC domain-containing protein [Sporolactobacillus shoreae]